VIPLRIRGAVTRAIAAIIEQLNRQATALTAQLLEGHPHAVNLAVHVDAALEQRLASALLDVLWAEAQTLSLFEKRRPIVPTPVTPLRASAVEYANTQAARLVVEISEDTRAQLRKITSDFMGRVQRTGPGPSWKLPVSGPRFAPESSWRSEGMTQAMRSHIKAEVGLTERQRATVQRYADSLQNELHTGTRAAARRLESMRGEGRKLVETQAQVDRLVQNYATNWRTYRAETIAATETHAALMAGRQAVWERAQAEGRLSPLAVRVWQTNWGDSRVCERCQALDGAVSAMRGVFIDGAVTSEAPPLHPRCRCWLEVQERNVVQPPTGEDVIVEQSRSRRAKIFR
jgi:hypothetical protein